MTRLRIDRFRQELARLGAPLDREIIAFETIDSTSSELRRRLSRGAEVGTVVVADRQFAGRGRLGRSWQSDTLGNLYLSVAVSLAAPRAEAVARLPLVAGLCVCKVLLALSPALAPRLKLKWPNDVLLDTKKAGGILCELVAQPREAAIVGLGLNLRTTEFDDTLRATATSLQNGLDVPLEAEIVGAGFVASLERQLNVFAALPMSSLVEHWTAAAEPFGRRVRVGQVEGITIGMSPDGRLVLCTPDGQRVEVVGGIVEESLS